MNEAAVHLQYSLPVIHEVVTQLDPAKNKFYSLLDISDAFIKYNSMKTHIICYI